MSEVLREDLISRTAAIAKAGVHRNTFDRWAARAGLKKYRVLGDNRVFFLRADLDERYEIITEVSK